MTVATLDTLELENKVKEMYRQVAEEPDATFHFEMGRALALRLGYLAKDLYRIPAPSVDSFAGVGYYFGFADIQEGESVLDLGSGSGMDTFVASLYARETGKVTGVDMTDAQLQKAERLRREAGFSNIAYVPANIMRLPFADNSFDVVISNGVINLCSDKPAVFSEAYRVLKPGGRLALSDIVSETQLPEKIVCNASLWAACIGGAMQEDKYRQAIAEAGFTVQAWQVPQYGFISNSAKGATETYRVKSMTVRAIK